MTILQLKNQRFRKVCLMVGLLLSLGLIYAGFVLATGFFIPCPFRVATGLQCPGCGVSHMCLALMQLDFRTAWVANRFLFSIGPALAIIIGRQTWRWVQTGSRGETVWERRATIIILVAAIAWGILRNCVPGL